MFDLEKAIAAWRRTYEHHRTISPEDRKELEYHLRDQIDAFVTEGMTQEQAFDAALREVGDLPTAEQEYGKVFRTKERHQGRLLKSYVADVAMLRSYLKVAIRNLRRHAGYAALNVAGLALGLACCLVIGYYVWDALSYERFFTDSDQIYRLGVTRTRDGDTRKSPSTPVPLGPALHASIPEIEHVVRFWRAYAPIVGSGNRYFDESALYFTDPDVFDVFSLPFIEGDPKTALSNPGSLVMTASSARRYFGDADPIGQQLQYTGYPADSLLMTVTGVVEDVPHNSHVAFDMLASLRGVDTELDNWGSFKPIWTYVKLARGSAPDQLAGKLTAFKNRWMKGTWTNTSFALTLEPIERIQLHSDFGPSFKPVSDVTYVYLFGVVGMFILLIAVVNFVNLSTARSIQRAREVGMRKVLGAYRGQLIFQFLSEAFLLTVAALVMALIFVTLTAPALSQLLDLPVRPARFVGTLLPWVVAGGLGISLLAGFYPALVLSGFRPLHALAQRSSGSAGAWLRKSLVVFQFGVSVVLLVGTAVVYMQLDYIRHKPLGFDRDQVVVLPYTQEARAIRDEILQNPSVLSASVSQRVPGNTMADDHRPVLPEGLDEPVQVESYVVDSDFAETYRMEIVAGRDLDRTRAADTDAFLINETAVKHFGWKSPQDAVGRQLTWTNADKTGPVVGVVKDFQIGSLHDAIGPVVLLQLPDEHWWQRFISVRIRPAAVTETLAFLESTWRSHAGTEPYSYFFLDDSFEALHRADQRFGRIFGAFAGLAIVIACLGLFGLAAFSTQQRFKEIGIRKALGATAAQVTVLLSKDFLRLVLVAFVVAAPLAYYGMRFWLDRFAYRIAVSPLVPAAVGLAVMAIAVLTVAYQSIKAARADPVDSLRYE